MAFDFDVNITASPGLLDRLALPDKLQNGDFDVKVTTSPGLIDRMSTLPDKLQRKGAVAAARKAMRMVVECARADARRLDDPQTAENIAKNIISQNSPRTAGGSAA
jgi:hypothetical protein